MGEGGGEGKVVVFVVGGFNRFDGIAEVGGEWRMLGW